MRQQNGWPYSLVSHASLLRHHGGGRPQESRGESQGAGGQDQGTLRRRDQAHVGRRLARRHSSGKELYELGLGPEARNPAKAARHRGEGSRQGSLPRGQELLGVRDRDAGQRRQVRLHVVQQPRGRLLRPRRQPAVGDDRTVQGKEVRRARPALVAGAHRRPIDYLVRQRRDRVRPQDREAAVDEKSSQSGALGARGLFVAHAHGGRRPSLCRHAPRRRLSRCRRRIGLGTFQELRRREYLRDRRQGTHFHLGSRGK